MATDRAVDSRAYATSAGTVSNRGDTPHLRELTFSYGQPGVPGAITAVFLPGLFAGGWIWEATIQTLQSRGLGTLVFTHALAEVDCTVPVARCSSEILKRVKQLHLTDVVLFGDSLGGLIALDAAATSSRVAAVVVSGAPGLAGGFRLGGGTTRKFDRSFGRALAARLFNDADYVTDAMIDAALKLMQNRGVALNVVRALKAARSYDVVTALSYVLCPALLVWGENDRVTPVAPWETKIGLLPDGELCKLAECGHVPMMEKPVEFNSVVTKFLDHRGLLPVLGTDVVST